MALEWLINIRIYKADGTIDNLQSWTASLYDNLDNSLDGTGSLVYNTTTQNYQYDFTPVLDLAKTYTVNLDFGVNALVRYASFGIGGTSGGGGLTTTQDLKLMSLTGGIAVNYQTINSHTTKEIAGAIKDIEKKIDEIPAVSFEEVCADIKLARDNIIDKIEYEVNDAKEATKWVTKDVKAEGVKIREVVKQKSEKIEGKVAKLADRQDDMDKTIEREADEIDTKLDKIYEQEAEMIEHEMYNAEADEIEKVTP